MLFKKRDKRYNDYYDNYTNRVFENLVGGLLWLLFFALVYGAYRLFNWLF